MRPAEFISPNKPIFGLVKGRLCICWVCKGKMASLLEPHNEFYPKFFMYPELSRVGLLGVRIVRLVVSHEGECQTGLVEGEAATTSEPHTLVTDTH